MMRVDLNISLYICDEKEIDNDRNLFDQTARLLLERTTGMICKHF